MNYLRIFVSITVLSFSLAGYTQNCNQGTSLEVLHGNTVRTAMLNGGDMWWNLEDGKYSVPFAEDSAFHRNVLFAGAVWIGGIDNGGKLRLAAQTYRQGGNDFWPGPLDENGETTIQGCLDFDTHYKATRAAIEHHKSLASQNNVQSGGEIPISEIPLSIRNWPAAGNNYFTGETGTPIPLDKSWRMAPYVNFDGQDGYNPTKGDHPDIFGSQEAIFWMINDPLHEHTASGSSTVEGGKPLGMEIRKMAYAYNQPGILDSTTFYHFEYQAKERSLDSFYLSLFIDVDLGNYSDDYVGCDTTRNLAIGYNGDGFDEGNNGYGADPPFVGIDFLNIVPPNGQESKGMSSFMYYNNDFSVIGNPENPSDFYGYMKGMWKDSTYPTFPPGHVNAGNRTHYMFYSEPDETAPGAWSECLEGNTLFDRRFVMSSGPYTLEKGETLKLDFAVIFARCSDYEICPSFDCIQQASDKIQQFYEQNITGIANSREPSMGWRISPNPAKGHFNIRLERPAVGEIEIYNSMGTKIERRSINETTNLSFDLTHQSAGVYFIKLRTHNIELTKKVIITGH